MTVALSTAIYWRNKLKLNKKSKRRFVAVDKRTPGKAYAQPTERQFLQVPRAKEIREICIEICACMEAIMNGSNSQDIDQLHTKLINLGITPNCQTGLDQSTYGDPLIMAEYVAGQMLTWQGDRIPSQEMVNRVGISVVQEHSTTGMVSMLGEDLPKTMKDFLLADRCVFEMCKFLDVDRKQLSAI